ncbi:MAG TPA: hypothetical protein VIY52_34970 [Streptosporangiaceae bacterium]
MELIMGEHFRRGQRERMETCGHPDDDAGDLEQLSHLGQGLGHWPQDEGRADPGRRAGLGPRQWHHGSDFLERLFHDDIQSAGDTVAYLSRRSFRERISRSPPFRKQLESWVSPHGGEIVGDRLTQPIAEASVMFRTVNYGRCVGRVAEQLGGQFTWVAFDLYKDL